MNDEPKSLRLLRPSNLEGAVSSGLTPRVDPLIGQTIDGRYVIERSIGEGGMGVVYAGQHRVIGKKVAIKVLRREMAHDDELTARFLQEARAASAIGNPHIVDISDFGRTPDGSTYFVMELLEGRSLTELMVEARGPMPPARVVSLAKQMAQGLAAAHAASIVHRDLKPDNVMVVARGTEQDFVKILDFGIAKVGGAPNKMTRAGSVFGTPHYMSPEQAAGAPVDHRTDIYALGVIVYEMAAGRVPFDAENMMAIISQHMYRAPAPMRALVPAVDVPPGLDAIVLKCLSKRPEGRYANMTELGADLQKLESGGLPGAVADMMARTGGFQLPPGYAAAMPHPIPASPGRRPARWPLFAVIGAVGTTLVAVLVVLLARGVGGAGAHARSSASTKAPSAATVPSSTAAPTASIVAAAPTPSPSAAAALASAAPSVAVPARKEILISVRPDDATVLQDDRDLGSSPVALHLADGETATLVVSRKGYKPKTMSVDGHDPKVTIVLDPVFAGPAPAPATRPAGGIDDVGDPFAKKH